MLTKLLWFGCRMYSLTKIDMSPKSKSNYMHQNSKSRSRMKEQITVKIKNERTNNRPRGTAYMPIFAA